MKLLNEQASVLHPDIRKSLVQALMLLRTRQMVDQIELLSLFFKLLHCRDKILRQTLIQHIVSDIKNANQKCRNNKLNKTIQNHLYPFITGGDATDASDVVAKHCLDICISLYRKQIWNDAKCVNIIAEACLSPHNKVLVAAVKFFLGVDQPNEGENSDSEDENSTPDIRQLQFRATFTKKSKSQKAKLEKAMKVVKRKEKRGDRAEAFNFSALHMLNDPQGLTEKLFSRLNKSGNGASKTSRELPFEVRVMMMNLISRIIGLEKLILLNFYPFLIK